MIGFWTDDRVLQLKALWKRGDSASVIGGAMGITRNTVLGKVYRLQLEGRTTRTAVPPKIDPSPRRAPKRVYRASVMKAAERNPAFKPIDPDKTPALLPVMSALTGHFLRHVRKHAVEPEYTKPQLRAMLTQAVLNTAGMK